MLSLLSAICASALGAVGCQQDQPTAVAAARFQQAAVLAPDTTLAPNADTYVERSDPSANYGTRRALLVGPGGERRALLRWDNAALAQAAAGGTVTAARLELTLLAEHGDRGERADRRDQGGSVELHRLTHSWTETGATWSCSDEQHPVRSRPECPRSARWVMGEPDSRQPWVSAPSATARPGAAQRGVVALDVTADVLAWLSGTENDGWILTGADGRHEETGQASFGSRESRTPPRLILSVQAADTSRPPIPQSTVYPRDTLYVVTNPADTGRIYYRRLYEIMFLNSASGSAIRALLAKYRASIVAGAPFTGSYIVMMPDPGATWQAVQARQDSLDHEPIVWVFMPLIRRDNPPVLYSRFPVDGDGHARSNWFDGSVSTWAHWAIGAPLAWGCETGTYAAFRPRVGVLEWRFDTTIADLRASTPVLTMSASNGNSVEANTTRYESEYHGGSVAATLSAAGDNAIGMAGMVWRSDLRYYALGAQDMSDPDSYSRSFREGLLPQIVADQPAVLSVSVGFGGNPNSVKEMRLIVKATMRLFRESPRTLVVVAAGNAGTDTPIDALLTTSGTNLGFEAALARIARDSGFADRIVVVGGTMPGNQRWTSPKGGSDFFPGLVGIAAPAQNVPTIWKGAVALGAGTSLAAPLVAGAALQLVSMDSTLTPADVKKYLLRGDSEPYEDYPGHLVHPSPVSGFDGSVFQLNAYRSLRLLSSERPGTPICGYPVRAGEDAGTVVLEPRGASPRTITVPGGTAVAGLSVAQGGRLIAVLNDDYGVTPRRTILMDQNGLAVGSPLVGIERRFLERGTADVTYDAARLPSFRITNGGATQVFDPFHGILAGLPGLWQGFGDIAPSGDYAALVALTTEQLSCGSEDIAGRYLAALGSLTSQPLGAETYPVWDCSPLAYGSNGNTALAFSHDGRRVVFLATRQGTDSTGANLFQTTIVRAETAGGSETHTVTGLYMDTPRFTADDSLFVVGQSDVDGNCAVAFRRADAPWTVVGTPTAGRPGIDCWAYPVPSAPNAPIARAGAARGLVPVGRSLRGLGGFAPAPSALRAVSRRPATVRVQVN